ncbi:MAG: DUF6816 family protein, partial [Dolichospermum sp.]
MLIKIIISCCLMLLLFLGNNKAQAGELAEHLAKFPQWEKLTSVKPAEGDLVYPDWIAGKWKVTSTLIDLAAPLAPNIITPGFENNRSQLNQKISFLVRIVKFKPTNSGLKILAYFQNQTPIVVATRLKSKSTNTTKSTKTTSSPATQDSPFYSPFSPPTPP